MKIMCVWMWAILSISIAFPPLLFAFPARFALSPDHSNPLVISTLESAKKNILINIYQIENQAIVDSIIRKIKNGITVQVLIEGTPVGQMSPIGKQVLAQLQKAMRLEKNSGNRLLLMKSEHESVKRRFRWNHAKYLIIDTETVLVSSENFTLSGHPSLGMIGNRGWEVVLENRPLAEELTQIFKEDSNVKEQDIVLLWPSKVKLKSVVIEPPVETSRHVPSIPPGYGEVETARLLVAPQVLDPLLDIIRSAKKNLDFEQMSLPSVWRDLENNQKRSPLVRAILERASQKVRIRVLLNDESVFSNTLLPISPRARPLSPNEVTLQFLKEMARCYRLPIEARLVNTQQVGITYIHNKGILVDGRGTLVSSINGTQNSVMANREVALWLESEEAASYFGRAFHFDWENSKNTSFDSRIIRVRERSREKDCPPPQEIAAFGFNELWNTWSSSSSH